MCLRMVSVLNRKLSRRLHSTYTSSFLCVGISIGTASGGSYPLHCRFGVNYVEVGDADFSEWAITDVIVWDRHLTYDAMKQVSYSMLQSLVPCPADFFWDVDMEACRSCPSELTASSNVSVTEPVVSPTLLTVEVPTMIPSQTSIAATCSVPLDYLVVAGGGSACYGSDINPSKSGGGGGGGGVLTNVGSSAYFVPCGKLVSIVVGNGGQLSTVGQQCVAKNGDNSTFDTLTAIGGGRSNCGWLGSSGDWTPLYLFKVVYT